MPARLLCLIPSRRPRTLVSCPIPHSCALQLCWLLVLPCALVAAWDLQARQRFALSRPSGPELPAAERAWWAALALPGACPQLLLLAPAFSLALWRFMALAAGS